MGDSFLKQAAKYLYSHRKNKRWKQVVTVLAAVVVFITTYALILPAITMEKATVCGLEEHTHSAECYNGEQVLTCELEEHVHTETCYPEENSGSADKNSDVSDGIDNIGADTENGTDHVGTDTGNSIAGSGTENTVQEDNEGSGTTAEQGRTFQYEDDTLAVEVILPENTSVPEDAVLNVQPIKPSDDSYSELTEQANEVLAGQTEEIALYDISFYTLEEEYIPVSDAATVSFRFKQSILGESSGNVAVLHYEEENTSPVALDEVDVERDENDALAALTFKTEGFSVYAVVKVASDYQRVINVNDLDGKSVAILSNNARYAMMAGATSDKNGRLASAVTSTADLSAYTFWTFEKNTDGTYYISNSGNYLVMGAQTLKTTTTKNQASAFTVKIENGLAEIGASVNGATYYINLFGGEDNQSGFKSWTSSTNNRQQLYAKTDNVSDAVKVTDLEGQSFVIANLNTAARQYAMSSVSTTNNTRLSATPVSTMKAGDVTYVGGGEGLTTWTFMKTDTDGVYYIQADDTRKYLSLTGNSLTISDTPQAITVTTSGSYPGQVRLSVNNIAVDWHGGNNPGNLVFGPYNGTNQNDYQTLCKITSGVDLIYDINTPSMSNKGSNWQTQPSLAETIQSFDGITQLFGKPEGFYTQAGPAGLEGLYRFSIYYVDDIMKTDAWKKGFQNEWYGEERFDGWTVTKDGVTYLLEPNTSVQKDGNETLSVKTSKTITKDSAGNDVITEGEEQTIILSKGTLLTGHWTEVSNVVTFFVNFKGTILDTEGDVSGRRSDTFTKVVAVGHVFYGKQKVGVDNTFGSGANAEITAAFRDKFDPADPDTQIVVHYLRTAADVGSASESDYYTNVNLKYVGANSNVIEANTLQLLKDTGRTIQVATGTGTNPIIDNELCDVNHYEMRWYVMKEQTNTWHIDGVLVAKTAEIAVVKTLAGLPENKVGEIMSYKANNTTDAQGKSMENITSFRIDTKLGNQLQDYLTFGAKTIAGQVDYLGATNTNSSTSPSNSFRWTLHAITHEKYSLEEEQYELEGYDVSSILVHYYVDEAGNVHTVSGNVTGTADLPADSRLGETETFPVTGGHTTAVSFNNFYTKTGTGALALVKLDSTFDDYDSRSKLHGAEFTLYTDIPTSEKDESTGDITWSGSIAKDADKNQLKTTSNDNGLAYFNNLNEGTYYLAETKAPLGYIQTDNLWKVVVRKNGTIQDSNGNNKDNVEVTVYPCTRNAEGEIRKDAEGDIVFAADGIKAYSTEAGLETYSIKNDSRHDTMIITKTFSGLSAAEMNLLMQNSKLTENADANKDGVIDEEEQSKYVDTGGYYLSVVGYKTDDKGNKTEAVYTKNLTLTWSYESMDGYSFTWHIAGLNQDLVYVLTEHNCFSLDVPAESGGTQNLLGNYEELIVTGTVNKADELGALRNLVFTKDRVENTVSTSGGKKMNRDTADVVDIKNTYANTFSLKLRKVDSVTKEPLRGAEFKIYGTYEESTNPADKYTYTDDSGKTQTMYYIQTITSGTDGYAVIEGLRLSQGTNNFAYVLNETSAPNGYEEAAPQVVTVTVDEHGTVSSTGEYVDGILNYDALNTRQENATMELNTTKEWVGSAKGSITLELYQVEHALKNEKLPEVAIATKVAEVTLDGTAESEPSTSKDIYGYESKAWKVTWKNLPVFGPNYGTVITETGSGDTDQKYDETHYHYFVREVSTIAGYETSYACYDHNKNELSEAEAIQELKLDENAGASFRTWMLADSTQSYDVTITNSQHYELPESGSFGTKPFTIGGGLITAGSLLYGYRLRRKRERRVKK